MTDQSSTQKKGRIPWITVLTIIVCTALLPYGELLSLKPVFVIDAFTTHSENIGTALLSFVVYMFQHSTFEHYEGNIIFFVLCGAFLEQAIGRWRFAVFVLATGIGAGLVHVLLKSDLTIGVIGLSGVTMGLMATVAVAGRRLINLGWLVLVVRALVLITAGLQLFGYFFGKGMQHGDSSSYSLHLGSAVVGLSLYLLWLREGLIAEKVTSGGVNPLA